MRRTREIQRVVAQIRRQQRRGVRVDPAEIEQRFSHLMPELAGRLQLLNEIRESARRASASDAGRASSQRREGTEDLAFLERVLPEYELIERISDGAQGILYKARHKPSAQVVAIKLLLDGPLASELQQCRFEREIELVARLQHPYIVRLFDRGTVRGRLYFAMEFIDGLPIDDYAYANDLQPRQVARLFGHVAEALHYAHEHGIVHRDLKPTNILVDRMGKPHLLDFGLAKDAGRGEGRRLSTLTLAGQVFGTLPYLSPEEVVLEEGGEVDARSDVYAIGVMLFEVLTGAYPYPVTGRRELVRDNILFREPMSLRKALARQGPQARLSPSTIEPGLEAVIRKALCKDRSQRYGSAKDLAADLRSHAAGRPVQAASEGHLESVRRLLRRHRMQVALSAGLAVVALIIAGAWQNAARQAERARRNAAIAHSTLYSVVDHIEEGVHPFAGRTAAREALLRSLASDLRELQDETGGTEADARLAVALFEQRGDVAALRGRDVAAAEHYGSSLALLDAADAGDTDDLLRRARVQRKLGTVSPDARARYEFALQAAERVLARQPDCTEAVLETLRARHGLGQWLFDRGDYAASREQAERMITARRPPQSDPGQVEDWDRLHATALSMKGRNHVELGQGAEGSAALSVALQLRSGLSATRPEDVDITHELMLSHIHMGDARRDAGDTDAALASYGRAADIGHFLQRVDPLIGIWTRDLYSVEDRLARALIRLRRTDDARVHCETAQALAQALMEGDPTNPRWRRFLGFAYILRGRLAMTSDKHEAALREFQEAVTLRQTLVGAGIGDPALAGELATALDFAGGCHRKLGSASEALACYERAYHIRQRLLHDWPHHVQRICDVVRSQVSLCAWHLDRGNAEHDLRAAEMIAAAEALLDALANENRLEADAGRVSRWRRIIEKNKDRLRGRGLLAASPG